MSHIGFNMVVAGARNTGARVYLTSILRHLLELDGPERYTVYFRRDEDDDAIDEFTSIRPGLNAVRTPLPMVPTAVRVLRGEAYWRGRIAEDRLDVFHHTYFPLPLGVQRRARVVLTLYDLIQRGMPGAFLKGRRRFTNAVQPSAFRRSDRIAVISNAVIDDLLRYHPDVPREKVRMVPCAVDAVFLERGRRGRDPAIEATVRERYGLPDTFILGVGHLEPRKNWARLIQAYANLREEMGERTPELVIVGVENWEFGDIYSAAATDRVRQHVRFTGYVETEHLPEIYGLAMMFAYPSLYEGFGIPVLEAMAVGVPVLTSNVTSLPEVSGGAACLVDPYSVESIHQGLARMVSDAAYRDELVRLGRSNVERYSWRMSAEMLRDVYRELA